MRAGGARPQPRPAAGNDRQNERKSGGDRAGKRAGNVRPPGLQPAGGETAIALGNGPGKWTAAAETAKPSRPWAETAADRRPGRQRAAARASPSGADPTGSRRYLLNPGDLASVEMARTGQ